MQNTSRLKCLFPEHNIISNGGASKWHNTAQSRNQLRELESCCASEAPNLRPDLPLQGLESGCSEPQEGQALVLLETERLDCLFLGLWSQENCV